MKCEELFGMYITSPSAVQRSLSKIIRECISIEVSELEPNFVSKFICNGCVYKLEQFYAFRQQSLKSQEYYNGLFYQQPISCSSKSSLELTTGGVVQMPESVDSVFDGAHQQIQPDQSIHSSNELADINFSNEFMMDETEKNQLSKDYDDLIRSLQKDDLDFTTNDDELVSLSEAHVQEIIADVYNATSEKIHSTEEMPSPQPIDDVQCSEISDLHPSDSYFSMVDFGETDTVGTSIDTTITTTTTTNTTNTTNSTTSNSTICTNETPKDLLNDKTCEICLKTFRTRQKLTIHRNTHLRLAPFKCTFESCNKAFKSRIGLEEHVARHTNSFEYTCDICSKGFQHRSYLSAHRRAHNTERNFQCGLCGQTFKSKQALLDHKNRHLGVKPFACELCDKQYAKKSLLQTHIQQHHSKRAEEEAIRFSCSECGKQFTSKSYLNVHMRIHRNERPFVCEVCNKGHVTRKDLAVHMTSHTGEKPHTCEFCGKAYARRNALDWHRRSHTKERPYICDICGQTFSQATPLQVHKKLHDTTGHKKQLPFEVQQLATDTIQEQTR
uniref:Protein krueppel n=1 Tax=Anopheles epiroticus TaxID=199890 RepID=A0A182PS66_9DIPT